MRKWVAWRLVQLSELLHNTNHYCAVRFESGGVLIACDAYGRGMNYGYGRTADGEESWELKEFDFDDVDAALDWMHREEGTDGS